MLKKIYSIAICVLFALNVILAPLGVLAQEEGKYREVITISTAEGFLAFAENCRLDSFSSGLLVRIKADIDLTGLDFQGVPVFGGELDGGGHTVSGLDITFSGSSVGLFRYLTATAFVHDLSVSGDIHPQGSKSVVGGIAGSCAGTIENCTFSGDVSGAEYVGAIAGINALTGVIDGCRALEGSVHGSHFVGGIAGANNGVIRSSENTSLVNTTVSQNSIELSDITIETITSSESVNAVTDVGGIAGSSSGIIRDCINSGDVGYRHMGYNIGGIAGRQNGYITGCVNSGDISGRKEVGGIVGQMEPAVLVEYTPDTLQILEGQLGEVSQLASQAAISAQTGAESLSGHISDIQYHAQQATEALRLLMPGPDGSAPEIPDADTLLAALGTLSSSVQAMQSGLSGMASAAESTAQELSGDMEALMGQISSMGATLSNEETIGGALNDISDEDTPDDITGKVSFCENLGMVFADINAGGIAGLVAMETDLDTEDDYAISGSSSMNVDSQLRAVILSCGNSGAVTVKKQYGGGIAGFMLLGLAKDCTNSGALDCVGADYVGGIAGQSYGYIRSCSAKCTVEGHRFVGGIAGSAALLTDCRSMVTISGSEKIGAVLGHSEITVPEDSSILGNFYLPVGGDTGAVDGISYDGIARALSRDEFLALEGLPKIFRQITVRFVFDDGSVKEVICPNGGSLMLSDIPSLEQREGYTARWEGLELTPLFDGIVTAVYTPLSQSAASEQTGRRGLPVLIAAGSVNEAPSVSAGDILGAPQIEKHTLLDGISFELAGFSDQVTLRWLAAEDYDVDSLVLYILTDKGWQQADLRSDGSYIVFAASADAMGAAVYEKDGLPVAWLAAGGAAVVGIIVLTAVICTKRRKLTTK